MNRNKRPPPFHPEKLPADPTDLNAPVIIEELESWSPPWVGCMLILLIAAAFFIIGFFIAKFLYGV